jgi:hypothetical protein
VTAIAIGPLPALIDLPAMLVIVEIGVTARALLRRT